MAYISFAFKIHIHVIHEINIRLINVPYSFPLYVTYIYVRVVHVSTLFSRNKTGSYFKSHKLNSSLSHETHIL